MDTPDLYHRDQCPEDASLPVSAGAGGAMGPSWITFDFGSTGAIGDDPREAWTR